MAFEGGFDVVGMGNVGCVCICIISTGYGRHSVMYLLGSLCMLVGKFGGVDDVRGSLA